MAIVRQRLQVRGVVQGVGFRPHVVALAARWGLHGHVTNDGAGVSLEVEGEEGELLAFTEALQREAPPLARIESVAVETIPCRPQDAAAAPAFRILPSVPIPGALTAVSPDIATCEDCLREMRDPADRRFRYPFINCTNCGPRYTIVRDIPYDRARTTMASFAMCDDCRREYSDPTHRRFHAQPNACPTCGPRLEWRPSQYQAAGGGPDPSDDDAVGTLGDGALQAAIALLRAGGVVAVKGIGGFHLACDATHPGAVARLRARKRRGDKPFALLVADLDAARRIAQVSDAEAALLTSPARPIVLLARRSDTCLIADAVAPRQPTLGVMLPYAPLHHLLAVVGPLVMTSGNVSDEPIVRENHVAFEALASLADGFLLHDRDIHVVCDDSVVRITSEGEFPLRRSRGYAPYPVHLAMPVPHVLAVGGELKATACLTRDRYAILSPHVGDLGNLDTLEAMERACAHLMALFRVAPSRIACDLHPAYHSSRWARHTAVARELPLVEVQHHHAHLAALMAEHGLGADDAILAFTFDGTGFGLDGGVWGGEVLLGGFRQFERVAHLATTPLPGGDAAVRHPARVALAQLWEAALPWNGTLSAGALSDTERRVLRTQLERTINCATSSSMGRFLDAAASLAGGRHVASYEGQAAIEFEGAAQTGDERAPPYRFSLEVTDAGMLRFDGAPVLRQVVGDAARGRPMRDIARSVHAGIAECIVEVARAIRTRRGIDVVGLTGGVFQNVLLQSLAVTLLRRAGFTVLTHRRVPPTDGGLALGQAMVAAFAAGPS